MCAGANLWSVVSLESLVERARSESGGRGSKEIGRRQGGSVAVGDDRQLVFGLLGFDVLHAHFVEDDGMP